VDGEPGHDACHKKRDDQLPVNPNDPVEDLCDVDEATLGAPHPTLNRWTS
jgi:hypothetical protein